MSTSDSSIDFATVLASAAHDMKNSLCLLIQSIDNLQQEQQQLDSNGREELSRIHYEANRLNINLLQLLSLYRIEKNQLPLQIDQYYISDLFEEILLKNEMYINQKNIQVEVQDGSDLLWYFDSDLISNLLNDMFVNALRYTKSKLLLRAELTEYGLAIELHDDGPGYPEFMLENADTLMKDLNLAAGRTGLGLFFAGLIAKAHKNHGKTGFIRLNNGGVYGGAMFSLYLP
ncbi:MAG: sensor histidine kinase [Gammaproteobacteria bacterium]|nr:sensor histidine kinase [Gammaproteobacteria bacterium]MBU2058548.1 sensor histidine kinase [Gammaproteobacteria bacterium]MBU2175573.1 sensor histidine kinase [Gammaproteobacteria bacterium]MBU2248659.1 sensor histidine kinase [Gammaproteobacteria bacterium]MBU2344802.1 sensor histidine kinase [Gammaproteobacteria bacterium]